MDCGGVGSTPGAVHDVQDAPAVHPRRDDAGVLHKAVKLRPRRGVCCPQVRGVQRVGRRAWGRRSPQRVGEGATRAVDPDRGLEQTGEATALAAADASGVDVGDGAVHVRRQSARGGSRGGRRVGGQNGGSAWRGEIAIGDDATDRSGVGRGAGSCRRQTLSRCDMSVEISSGPEGSVRADRLRCDGREVRWGAARNGRRPALLCGAREREEMAHVA